MPRPTRNHAELRVTFDGWLEFREVSGLFSGAISLCVVEWCIAGPVGVAGIIAVVLHDIVAGASESFAFGVDRGLATFDHELVGVPHSNKWPFVVPCSFVLLAPRIGDH